MTPVDRDRRSFLGASVGLGVLALGGRSGAAALAETPESRRLRLLGFRGRIVQPGEADYAAARRMFVANPRLPHTPRLIAVCEEAEDARRALRFALDLGMPFTVRSGGHDLLAASIGDGLVIDLGGLRAIQVDPVARRVRVGAGVRAGQLNEALARHGLVAALGCASQVGVSGLTLGGGLGWFAGRLGAACDHLLEARLLTMGGEFLRVAPDEHPDLLWALRGGGGNFGIVTELTLRTHPMPDVTSGVIALDGRRSESFLERYGDFLANAPRDLDCETYIMAPAGDPVIFVKACYSGAPHKADRALFPIRTLAPLLAEDLARRPYTGMVDPAGPVAPLFKMPTLARSATDVPGNHVRSVSLEMSGAAAQRLGASLAAARGSWIVGLGHHMHGALVRPPSGHSSLPRTEGLLTTYFIANWRQASEAHDRMRWVDAAARDLRPYAGATYLNYLTSSAPEDVRAAYGRSYPRLRALKAKYDPAHRLRSGRAIEPGRSPLWRGTGNSGG